MVDATDRTSTHPFGMAQGFKYFAANFEEASLAVIPVTFPVTGIGHSGR